MRAIVIAGILSVSSSTFAYADEWEYGEPSEHTVFIGLGLNYRHLGSRDQPKSTLARSFGGVEVPDKPKGNEVWSFDERAGVTLDGPFYVAFDFEFGNLGRATADIDACTSMLAGLASFGANGNLGMLRIGGEITGGIAQYSFDREWDANTEGVLEARARVDLWISPWGTLGMAFAASPLHREDWMAGIYIGAHADPYGAPDPMAGF